MDKWTNEEITKLAGRLYDMMNPYDIWDTGATTETIEEDITKHPLDVIEYLVNVLEQEGITNI